MKSVLRTLLAGLVAVPVATIALALPASAHVEGSATAAGGGLTTVTLNVEHGCADLPLTGLRVQMPAGASEVSAASLPGWESSAGRQEIVWSGGSQPAHEAIDMVFTLKLAQAPGEEVSFPTIETCPGAEIAWIEGPNPDGSEAEHPAPTITVPAAGGSAAAEVTTTTMGTHSTATMAPEQTPITQKGSETHNAGLIVLLVVMAIIIGGAIVLYLRNRRPKPTAES